MEYNEVREIWTKEFIPILEKWGFELSDNPPKDVHFPKSAYYWWVDEAWHIEREGKYITFIGIENRPSGGIVFVNGKNKTSFFKPTPQTVRSLCRKLLREIILSASGLNFNRYWDGVELDAGEKFVIFKFKLYKRSWEWEIVTDVTVTGLGTLEEELVKVKRPIDENPLEVLKILVSCFLL